MSGVSASQRRTTKGKSSDVILLAVAVGGALGAMGRLIVSSWIAARSGYALAGTFIINLSGALALGIFVGLIGHHLDVSQLVYRLIVTGMLGGYTTYSIVYFETYTVIKVGKPWLGLAYAGATQLSGILAVLAGMGMVALL